MDDRAKYEALMGEHEIEPGYLLRPDQEAQQVYVRVFNDQGGLVRLDVDGGDEGEKLQLLVGAQQLQRRISDPQSGLSDPQ